MASWFRTRRWRTILVKNLQAVGASPGSSYMATGAPTEKPPCGGLRRGCGARYAFASCFLKCSRAAFAASAGTIHEVFLTSGVRGKCFLRYPRRFFGSMPISSARALGVRFDDAMLGSFRASGLMYTYYATWARTSRGYEEPLQTLYIFGSDPPYRPPRRDRLTWRRSSCRAKRAGCEIFGPRLAAYGVQA